MFNIVYCQFTSNVYHITLWCADSKHMVGKVHYGGNIHHYHRSTHSPHAMWDMEKMAKGIHFELVTTWIPGS